MLNLQTALSRACLLTVLPGIVLMLSGCNGEPTASAPATQVNPVEPPPADIVDASPETPATSGAAEVDEEVVSNSAPKETGHGGDSDPNGAVETASTPAIVENDHDKWVQNFEQAKALAQKEGKDILMDFTGSDWCGWCIRLHNEVFQYQTFHDYADENLVLLELDFPNDKSNLTEEIIAQNDKLQAQFAIQGFPTILLLDSAGRPYGKTGYQEGGPENYVEHLTVLRGLREERDAALKEAEGLEGIERAKKLDDVLAALEPGLIYPAYDTEITQIIELDADNAAGLKEQYVELQLSGRFQQRFGEVQATLGASDDVEAVLAELQKLEQEFGDYPEGKNQSVMIRYRLLRQLNRNDEALAILDVLIESAGDGGDEKAQIFVHKSDTLVSLDRIDEARTAFEAARKAAESSRVRSALDRIEQQLFADVETKKPEGTPDGEPAAEKTPDDGDTPAKGDATADGDDPAAEAADTEADS